MAKPRLPKRPRKKQNPPEKPKTDDEIAYEELKKKLGHTKLMKANSATMNALVQRAAQSVTPSGDTWLTEWRGKGLGRQTFDLSALLEIGGSFGNTVRWYSRSLFDGGKEIGLPGSRAAMAGSLLLVLGPGLKEEPRYAAEEPFYPTVEGGRYLVATMAASNDHEALTQMFQSLSKSATKAYVTTLEVMVERELSVSTYVAADDGFRYTQMVLEQARDDLGWLSRKPRTKTDEIQVIGMFRAVDERGEGKFVISPEVPKGERKPADIVGRIAPDLRHRAMTTRARVKATLRVKEATETWLPRAPRTERTLIDFERMPRKRG